MRNRILHFGTTIIAAIAVALLSPFHAIAQDEDPLWTQVRTLQVKPGRNGEFGELQKQFTAAMKSKGQSGRSVYQEVGGDVGKFYVLRMIDNMAEFDTPFEPPMDDREWATWLDRFWDTIESNSLMMMRRYPDLGISTDDDVTRDLLFIRYRTVAPGKNGEYEAWIRDRLVPALRKGGVKAATFQRIQTGGNNHTWISGTAHANWAEMDEPALGYMNARDRDALLAAANALTVETENRIVRYRADLSE